MANFFGTSGDDILSGGVSGDFYIGGLGNDLYIVTTTGIVIVEKPGEGIDTVQSSINYGLPASVENLELFGSASINGTGNQLDNLIIGNSGNNTLNGGLGADTLQGGLGNDIYVVDNDNDVVIELFNEGTDTVIASIDWTLSANVENLTLSGINVLTGMGNDLSNAITGNAANNQLYGFDGNDTLDGGMGGDDFLYGGTGNDLYIIRSSGDRAIENSNEGTDTVRSFVNFVLAANVENLVLIEDASGGATIGEGNNAANYILGNTRDNTLIGGAGDDTLEGAAGNDTMLGGLGNDTYIIRDVGDILTTAIGSDPGLDTVRSSISWMLGSEQENLTLIGLSNTNGTGNAGDNLLLGNGFNNTLDGAAGNDTLDGAGGDDILLGSLGNDTYIIRNAGDSIAGVDAGVDTVQSQISWILGSEQENLILIGSTNISGTGNAGNNVVTGNDANNTLDGGGGVDILRGRMGDDVYLVNGSTVSIDEVAGEGIDTVVASITTGLANNVENLTLIGSSAINGTGNSLNNTLIGNDANNTLNGGLGNDTLRGEGGNDLFLVDSVADLVQEDVGEGIDTVQASVSYTLSLTEEVENLRLTGTAALSATGNGINNTISGNSGDNALFGREGNDFLYGALGNDTLEGGDGNDYLVGAGLNSVGANEIDVLIGGAGSDRFVLGENGRVYYNSTGTADFATIQDFAVGSDRLQLRGVASQYSLSNVSGSTQITYLPNNDLVGIVTGVTLTSISDTSVFSFV